MFLVPLRDEIRSRTVPYVTYSLIIINVIIYLWQLSFPRIGEFAGLEASVLTFGFVPIELAKGVDVNLPTPIPAWLTIFTSMFMHGGFAHILGNMWFLWIFGDNVEDHLGHGLYLLFYLLAGVGAALLQFLVNPVSDVPMVGASGAISGVLGAYFIMFPGARIVSLFWYFWFIQTIAIPAYIYLGYWALIQFLAGMVSLGAGAKGGVAFWAHIGGFIVGLIFGYLLRTGRIGITRREVLYPGSLRPSGMEIGATAPDIMAEAPFADEQEPTPEPEVSLVAGDPRIEALIAQGNMRQALKLARDLRLAAIHRDDLELARLYDEYVRYLRRYL